MTVRILVVDDETLVRSGLALLLDGADDGGMTVVGQAADGAAALSMVDALRPDVVLLDIRMPGMSGIGVLRELSRRPTSPAVLMLTAFDTTEDVRAALAAGARGFLRKTESPTGLVSAVRSAADGHTALGDGIVARLLPGLPHGGAAVARELLSDREDAVAALVAQGRTNEQIGRELHLALPTVKTYLSRIMDKLDATNRVQVAVTYLGSL
jgi:DNA-binding NarL/FixJ family response regulator